jgi:hypothetical protein
MGSPGSAVECRGGSSAEEQRALAYDLNLHRRQLSREQLAEVILKKRREGKSYRQIADEVGAHYSTVSRVASATPDALPETVTGKDGKELGRPACRSCIQRLLFVLWRGRESSRRFLSNSLSLYAFCLQAGEQCRGIGPRFGLGTGFSQIGQRLSLILHTSQNVTGFARGQ